MDDRRRQARQPLPGRSATSAPREPSSRDGDPVLTAAVRQQRLGEVAVLLERLGRPPVALVHGVEPLRLDEHGLDVGAQHLVGAEAAVPSIDDVTSCSRSSSPSVRPLSLVAAVVAQLGGQPLERRRLEEELLQLVGQADEHVLGEEVPVRAARAGRRGRSRPAARRPAAGPSPG